MKKTLAFATASLAVFFLAMAAQASPGEKLLLVGGGDSPQPALNRFCDAAGGKTARILVITWATGYPDETFKGFSEELAFCHPALIEPAPQAPFSAQQKTDFMARLKTYTAVFFTGGDQSRILDILDKWDNWGGGTLSAELRALYHQGIPFGGTSAGTAIMSPLSLTGNGDETVIDGEAIEARAGLGLIEGAIVDTHFIRRQRENRLFGLILKHPALLGAGIDQDTAIWLTDGKYAEVSGRAQVMLVRATAGGGLRIEFLRAGDHADLSKH